MCTGSHRVNAPGFPPATVLLETANCSPKLLFSTEGGPAPRTLLVGGSPPCGPGLQAPPACLGRSAQHRPWPARQEDVGKIRDPLPGDQTVVVWELICWDKR